ncbi:TonB-dependent receptor plug domain-containing protein [Cryomorphaceae bacterium]|nr:TonB-dependent receptor plug domain-containing protein [Cryomorphaceae bacterium]
MRKILALLLLSFSAYGQMDTNLLPEVDLWEVQVRKAIGAEEVRLDSSLKVGYFRLSESITAELPVYIKSYGPSAVATFSVRGTGAQHTDILWNGMSINSPMLGLYDLNLISPSAFDDVQFIYGGASLASGLSSFGGALNLSNKPRFEDHFDLGLQQVFGSYQTSHTDFNLSASNGRVFWRTRLLWDYSLNDFEYTNPRLPDSPTFVNEHAEVNQNQWIQEAGLALGERHHVIARLWLQQSNRKLPSLMSIYTDPDLESRSVQIDVQQRVQLEWNYTGRKWQSQLRSGASGWKIDFDGDESLAQTWQNQWRTVFTPDSLTSVESLVQYSLERGEAEAYPSGSAERHRWMAALSAQRSIGIVTMDAQVKQERVGEAWAPFQYQVGAAIVYGRGNRWKTSARIASQVRYPTLNDLFWGDQAGEGLSYEHSLQNELGQSYSATLGSIAVQIGLNGYANYISDYILWTPQNDLSWSASNVGDVQVLGAEASVEVERELGPGQTRLTASYSFTQSQDEQGNQLIFIPLHQARGRALYAVNSWTFSVLFVFRGKVHTDRDNDFYMPWYQTADARISYRWNWGRHRFSGFVQSANITNIEYQSLPLRPMPGRTVQLGLQWNLSNESF